MSQVRVQLATLNPTASSDAFDLHIAANEWSLIDPIIIKSEKDIKSKKRWLGFEPYLHQVKNLVRFCRQLPVTVLADDVGLGKTISAGLIITELMERKRITRVVVICPALIGEQWVEELKSKFGIEGVFAKGANLRRELNSASKQVVVTTYHSASRYLHLIPPDHFDMIILDEVHKLRNLHGTQQTPMMATRIRQVLEKRIFKYAILMTATPIQNRIWDLYSLIDLVTVTKGHANPLGNPAEFNNRYISDSEGRKLNPGYAKQFRAILREYVYRTRREELQLLFPKRNVKIQRIPHTKPESRMWQWMGRYIELFGSMAQISLAQAMMSSPEALAAQLENMSAKGSVSATLAHEARTWADQIPISAKLNHLLTLVTELQKRNPENWRLVVFATRLETQKAIGKALTDRGIKVGYIRGGAQQNNQETVQNLKAKPPNINVVVSTDAGAEGVNLQSCNVLVNYDLPWNPMVLEQRIGRIQRLGSDHAEVNVVNFVIQDSVEERIVGRLLEKLQAVAETIGDIEAILEMRSDGDEDDEGGSFEKMICELVVKSLRGQDVAEAQRRITQSIEEAKALLDHQKSELDTLMGKDPYDASDIRDLPDLKQSFPSLTHEEFARRAIEADGSLLNPTQHASIYTLEHKNAPLKIYPQYVSFVNAEESGLASHRYESMRVVPYYPGRPAFEKLVQKWTAQPVHYTQDMSKVGESTIVDLITNWCRSLPVCEYVKHEHLDSKPAYKGEILCKVKTANGVDSYEKISRIKVCNEEHGLPQNTTFQDAVISNNTLDPRNITNDIDRVIENETLADAGVKTFIQYYDTRIKDELKRAGENQQRQAKVHLDFGVNVTAELIGSTGLIYSTLRVAVEFMLDGCGEYRVELELLPVADRVYREPERVLCTVCQKMLPVNCLERCVFSGQLAARHLLVKSQVSGRFALPQHSHKCAVTGRIVLADEIAKSDVSGRVVAVDQIKVSPVSNRQGLHEEFELCQITDTLVLADELVRSDMSGRAFRKDQAQYSGISGRIGHKTEMVLCAVTNKLILGDEATISAVSGRYMDRNMAVTSELPSHRHGMPSEVVHCVVSQKRLLCDEAVQSAVSGAWMDKNLAVYSSISNKPALSNEMVVCMATGQTVLPDETAIATTGHRYLKHLVKTSPVSGRVALVEEFGKCDITGSEVLAEELVISDVSKRKFRKDQAVWSAESERVGHVSEGVTCCVTNKNILKDEAGASSVSGLVCSKNLLRPSEKPPHKMGIESEFRVCHKTGKRMLVNEVEMSVVSGQWYDREILVKSAESGRYVLPEEATTCEVTGAKMVPDETCQCAISGKTVSVSLTEVSALSGARALRKLMGKCAVTGRYFLPTELVLCGVMGQRIAKDQAVVCSVSNRHVYRRLCVTSAVSGLPLLEKHALRSPQTKRIFTPSEAVMCEWMQDKYPRDEITKCKLSDLSVSKSLLNKNGEFTSLRQMLDGVIKGEEDNVLRAWLKDAHALDLPGIAVVQRITAPKGCVSAVCCELRTYLGFKIRYAGLMVYQNASKICVLGSIVTGKRINGHWEAET